MAETSVFKENIKSVFAINCKIVNTEISRDVAEALASYRIPVLKAQIYQRVSFAGTAVTGQTVLEIDRKGTAA
jgi:chromosome partitioning protein